MVALRKLIFSIFVPGMVAIGIPYLYLQAQAQLALPSLVSVSGITGSLLVVVGIALYCWCASERTFRGTGTPAPFYPNPASRITSAGAERRWISGELLVASPPASPDR
jgi:hypothetical protein